MFQHRPCLAIAALVVGASIVIGCSGKTEDPSGEAASPAVATTPGAPGDPAALAAARAQCASATRGAVDIPHNRKELGERMAGRWLFCIKDTDAKESTAREHAGIEMTAGGDWWFLRLDGDKVVREGGVENGGQWHLNFGGTGDPPPNDTTQPLPGSLYLAVASGGTWAGAVAFESGPRRFVYTPNVTWHAAYIGPPVP